ncbi:MAG: ATP-binding cassette domain-containing protein [Christensenellales bacterium]
MNAVEIRNLTKSFRNKQVLNGLDMTVPLGSIYGFIGENGSGKSTTEKLISGLLVPSGGSIQLFGRNYKDSDVRAKIGLLIESPGCFANYSVWNNLMLWVANTGIKNPEEEVRKVLRTVRMEGSASNKFKNCSLGMKQRIGIAMALLGNPSLLILDEPINGLDVDGVRIMRNVLKDVVKNYNCTVIISSHVLGELEKIATHYGIIRNGKMIKEMTAEELNADCRTYVALSTKAIDDALLVLNKRYSAVTVQDGNIRVYDSASPEEIVRYLYENEILINEIKSDKISLEEYYSDLMKKETV